MLCLRNLHHSFEHKSQKKKLTVNSIAKVYSLDGLNRSPGKNDQKNFLIAMDTLERLAVKRLGNEKTLRNCVLWETQSPIDQCMSYATFKKRYNDFNENERKPKFQRVFCPKKSTIPNKTTLLNKSTLPNKAKLKFQKNAAKISCQGLKKATVIPSFIPGNESLQCMFCGKIQSSSAVLQKHLIKCQKQALKIRRQVMIKKVRSLIVKSKRPIKKKLIPIKKKTSRELPYKCDKCTDCFVSQHSLDLHHKYDHRPRPTCSICQRIFDCKRKLINHESECNGEDKLFSKQSLGVVDVLCSNKVLTCNKCDNLFTTADRLREHKLIVNKRLPIEIEITQEEIQTEKIFFKVCVKNEPEVKKKLVKFDKGENNCLHCGKEFQNQMRLMQHDIFCHVKNGVRRTRHTIKRNGQECLAKKKTTCKKCDIDFQTFKKLTKHNLLFHVRPKKTKKQKDIICTTCNKTFSSLGLFQKHFKLHNSPNICPICTRFKHFETNNFLQWHMSLFHKKKFCKFCQKAYKIDVVHKCLRVKSRQKGKVRLNGAKKSSQVPSRQSKVISKNILKKPKMVPIASNSDETSVIIKAPSHVQNSFTHYLNGKFTCHICAETLPREIYLMEHLITHTDLSPFKCKHCIQKFNDLSLYTSHLRWDHLEEGLSFNLCSLKHYLYEKLNLKRCRDCRDLFLNNDAIEKHRIEKHPEKHVVEFSLGSRDIIVDIGFEEVITIENDFTDSNSSEIKNAGPSLERILSPESLNEPVPTQCDEEYVSREEAEKLLLPLSLSCEEVNEHEEERRLDLPLSLPYEEDKVEVKENETENEDTETETEDESLTVMGNMEVKVKISKLDIPIKSPSLSSSCVTEEELTEPEDMDGSQCSTIPVIADVECVTLENGISKTPLNYVSEDKIGAVNSRDTETVVDEARKTVYKPKNGFTKRNNIVCRKRKLFVPSEVANQNENSYSEENAEQPTDIHELKEFPFRCQTCDINFLDQKMVENHNDAVHSRQPDKKKLKVITVKSTDILPSDKSHASKLPPLQFIDLSKELFARRPLKINNKRKSKDKNRSSRRNSLDLDKNDSINSTISPKLNNIEAKNHPLSNQKEDINGDDYFEPVKKERTNSKTNDKNDFKTCKYDTNHCVDHRNSPEAETNGSLKIDSELDMNGNTIVSPKDDNFNDNRKHIHIIPRGFKTITEEIRFTGNESEKSVRRSKRTSINGAVDDNCELDTIDKSTSTKKHKQKKPRCLSAPVERMKKCKDDNNNRTKPSNGLRKSKRMQITLKENNKNNNNLESRLQNTPPPLSPIPCTNARFEDELFAPLPKAPLPVNPTYFKAPKWEERSAFDLWNMH